MEALLLKWLQGEFCCVQFSKLTFLAYLPRTQCSKRQLLMTSWGCHSTDRCFLFPSVMIEFSIVNFAHKSGIRVTNEVWEGAWVVSLTIPFYCGKLVLTCHVFGTDILHVEGEPVFQSCLCLLLPPASFHFAVSTCNAVWYSMQCFSHWFKNAHWVWVMKNTLGIIGMYVYWPHLKEHFRTTERKPSLHGILDRAVETEENYLFWETRKR